MVGRFCYKYFNGQKNDAIWKFHILYPLKDCYKMYEEQAFKIYIWKFPPSPKRMTDTNEQHKQGNSAYSYFSISLMAGKVVQKLS